MRVPPRPDRPTGPLSIATGSAVLKAAQIRRNQPICRGGGGALLPVLVPAGAGWCCCLCCCDQKTIADHLQYSYPLTFNGHRPLSVTLLTLDWSCLPRKGRMRVGISHDFSPDVPAGGSYQLLFFV